MNETDGVVFEQPETFDERVEAASSCAIGLNLTLPTLIDDMNATVDEAYDALPVRLFLVDADGKISFWGDPGPMGFDVNKFEKAIAEHLESAPTAVS